MNQGFGPKLAAIVALICLISFSATAGNDRYLRIASGDRASGLFDLAGVVASAISNSEGAPKCGQQPDCSEIELTAAAQISSSAQAALAKLRSGAVDAAVVPDNIAYTTFAGNATRRTRGWVEMRSLATLSVRPMLIFVRGDLEVLSLANLRGWRIATGPRGTDVNGSITTLLAALGLTPDLYHAVSADTDMSAYEQIMGGKADAVVVLSGDLAAPERNGLLSGALKLYSPGKAELERAVTAYPFVRREVIDLGIGRNYTTLVSGVTLVVRADLPNAVVTALLSRLWHKNTDVRLNASDAALNLPAPLHTAAANFYQDNKPTESDRATP